MRLLFDATVLEYPLTGVAKVTLALYAASRQQDPSLEAVALHRRRLSAPLPPGIRSFKQGRFLPPEFWRRILLPAVTLRNDQAIVHFPWNGNVPSLPRSTVVLTTLHDVLPLVIPGFFPDTISEARYRKERQRDIARTDLLLTVSEYSQQEILRNFTVHREPVVIPNAPTLRAVPASTVPDDRGNYFLYVGGYDPRKGLQQLLEAFLGLHKEGKLHTKLVLTGSKLHVSDTFRRLVDEGLRMGAVEERGYVTDDALASLYAHALALVYPSKYEGFGLPPLEAMALGCPVITTRCTSLPEVCGDAAYYIEADDVQSIAQSLVDFETKPELRTVCSAKGREQSAKFTWKRAADTFLGALDATLRRRNAKGSAR